MSLGKRPREEESLSIVVADDDYEIHDYKFKVLLPNGISVGLTIRASEENEMDLEDFIDRVRDEYVRTVGTTPVKGRRRVQWRSSDIYVEDLHGMKITRVIAFKCFAGSKCNYVKLHDGVKEVSDTFENMWDLTPDTEMLMELPDEYTFETALADLIDNSLQAVWSNGGNERKLVRVNISDCGISIFDTGPGMDGTDKNSIVKWGKMGASLHRSARGLAIGGKPPYLTPSFGMFGYGGFIASMHLGRHALVSSKTKDSNKVYTLHIAREALLRSVGKTWKTDGGIRNPLEDEISSSPHGSFTKVEISQLKIKHLDTTQLKCRLKDIYFPYIQCDEMLRTGRTSTPIQFQVNGDDLAELEGGEVAITNVLSCNGPEFVLQLRIVIHTDAADARKPGSYAFQEANARLKCVYFPIVEGKESIDRILEKLKAEGCKVTETFDTFSRASIRRLGRLLPEARWGRLPFMEFKQRKGDKGQVLKRCCTRVKCFIDTDAGFNPTPSKTDLASQHPCTIALKNLGNRSVEKDMDISVEIFKEGKPLSFSQLEKEYEEWVFQMHDRYDEEIVSGEDPPVVVLCPHPQNKKSLGISSDVVRVHKVIKRKGGKWIAGQKIKILKGAAANCHKNNIYATLEYILLEGLPGEACGEARLICRPLHVPQEKGCLLKVEDSNASLDIRGSITFPISIIDSGKCKLMESAELEKQTEKLQLKAPSSIDILKSKECQQLDIDGAVAFDEPIYAGNGDLKKIIAVLRPMCFNSSSSSSSLDQKFIIKDGLEMSMEVTYYSEEDDPREGKFLYAERIKPSSIDGIHGFYIFSVEPGHLKLFQKSGIYKFHFIFNCEDSSRKQCEKKLKVLPDTQIGRWSLLPVRKSEAPLLKVGSYLQTVSLVCLDRYENRMPFKCTPELVMRIESKESVICYIQRMKVELSSNKLTVNISDIWIESGKLDIIRPHYKALLVISSQDERHATQLPCRVTPGPINRITAVSVDVDRYLLPGSLINELVLEVMDRYGNHVESGVEVVFDVDGLCFQDHKGSIRKVDAKGYIDLSGALKIKAGYGKKVSLSVSNGEEKFFQKDFQVEKRILRIVSKIPEYCPAGSQLEDIMFEVVDSEGVLDETIHDMKYGKSHTLKITSDYPGIDDSLQHSFFHGRCMVSSIPMPQEEGICRVLAVHSNHPDLCTHIQVYVTQPQKSQIESLYEHEDVLSECSDRGMLLLQDTSACLSKDTGILLESILDDAQVLANDVASAGVRVGEHEKALKLLREKKQTIEQEISDLQAYLEPQALSQLNYINAKEGTLRRIEGRANTAASVICDVLKFIQSRELPDKGIVGVVAMLATVTDDKLSRIFAEYLGEDNMLAVICKTYEAANDLEKYGEHGEVDNCGALYAIATEFGKSINGRFHVICLEELSPYAGKIESDTPQRKLALPPPCLPTGETPPGFLGYAVNFINIDARYINTRTTKGHGLRETLFYLLFGELQVYETRESINNARSFIKHGAVSLDGGIMKRKGFFSLGAWEPEVRFPVAEFEVPVQLPEEKMITVQQITDKKLELEATCEEIEKESQAHIEDLRDFQQKKQRNENYMNRKQPIFNSLSLMYSQSSQSIDIKTENMELD